MPPGDAWIEHGLRIEALGYATFLFRDHLAPVPAMMDTAMATTRLRAGTTVIDHDAEQLAQVVAQPSGT